jgi:ribosomal protein S18 acetylase RimI-like enzyme
MQVRPATISDAASIAHIHVETWRVAYKGHIPDSVLVSLSIEKRTTFWQERLAKVSGNIFAAEKDGSIIGFCDLRSPQENGEPLGTTGEIGALYVLQTFWRMGAGRMLLNSALKEAGRRGYHSVSLGVLASNDAARNFYEAIGFATNGEVKTEKLAESLPLQVVCYRIDV